MDNDRSMALAVKAQVRAAELQRACPFVRGEHFFSTMIGQIGYRYGGPAATIITTAFEMACQDFAETADKITQSGDITATLDRALGRTVR